MKRVLFVDDDVLSLQLIAKISDLLGFHAILSASPSNGLLLAVQEKPALIFVDMQMDEMDGTEFVRQVRSSPEISHLPVFICSAGLSYNDEERALRAGASGFIAKPLGVNNLTETLQKHIPQR